MKHANQPSARSAAQTEPGNGRAILLIDDNTERRHQFRSLITAAGYRVFVADSGAEALAIARRSEPDFVLMDWDLPGLSGPEFYARYRVLPRERYGYVILMTNARAHFEIAEMLEAGVDDVLTTPIASSQLLIRLMAGERVLRTATELRSSNARLSQTLDSLRSAQEAMDRDMREARKLQQGLVREKTGRFGSAQISLLLRPAGHIGGDLVGFFPISGSHIGFYALDVSGHGITSALLTAQLSVHLSGSSDHNVALRAAQSGSDAVKPVALAHFFNNMMLEEMKTETYFTMVYGVLDHESGRVDMALCGHPHPILQRRNGKFEALGIGGMPIGLLAQPIFDEVTTHLQPGDRLLIGSDGITEAADPKARLLGDDGLKRLMADNAYLSGHAFLEAMAWSVSEFCHGERQDDISALMIEYQGAGTPIDIQQQR